MKGSLTITRQTQIKVIPEECPMKGIKPAIVGLVWHDGYFYFTHRAEDASGAVARADMNGNVESVLQGIPDSLAEHQISSPIAKDSSKSAGGFP